MRTILALSALLTVSGCAHQGVFDSGNGLRTQRSALTVDETLAQLKATLAAKGFTIFAVIPHADGAASVNQALRPTTVVIFGNPQVGTPLMQCAQSAGIDLPQKILIHEDSNGYTSLTYNDPAYVFERHNIEGCDALLAKIDAAPSAIAAAAAHTR